MTRLSVRWTRRALFLVVAVWVAGGAVGAYYDAVTRHPSLTWSVVFGGRGGGAAWEVQIVRGDLAVFALLMMGMALVPALIGARRMSAAARTGRPHRGPSLWLISGVAVAMGLGPNIVGGFVLSDLYSPSSDVALVAGFAPQVLGVFVGGIYGRFVRVRFNPWRWVDYPDHRAPRGRPPRREPALRDWKRWAEESLRGERPPSSARRPRVRRAPRATSQRVEVTSDGVSWRTVTGRSGYLPAVRVGQIRLAEIESTASMGRAVYAYALVHGLDGAVLLRISATSGGAESSADRRLRELCAPLGVPVARHSSVSGRTKDLRRRWPEAFSWARAYPLVASVMATSVWLAGVVPFLDRLTGR